jgi:putative colanic acid biosysnthesis UDP-glucose lipid carrier transferase
MKGKYYSPAMKVMIFIIDFWLISLAFKIAASAGWAHDMAYSQLTSFLLVFAFAWIISGFLYKIYRIDSISLISGISSNLFYSFLVHVLLIIIVFSIFPIYRINPKFLIAIYALSALFIVISRVIYKLVLKYFEFSGFTHRKVVIVGITGSGKSLYQFFTSEHVEDYHFMGFFDDEPLRSSGYEHQTSGSIAEMKTFCLRENIDEIYFTLPLTEKNKPLLEDLTAFADSNCIYFRIAPDFSAVVHESHNVFMINSVPILTTRKEPLEVPMNVFLKRLFDIVFSSVVILTIFPIVIPIVALAIRLESDGPVFFKQLRPGRKNKLFECYKFRTMRVNQSTELQATKNDTRITRVGRLLRKTNIDELPQFFNVLLGNMSVVGPRPNLVSQLEEYSKTIQQYKVRHFITPGITGYAQVNGLRGETREPGLMEKRVQYDVLYLENWSLALDVKIILLTVWNMIKGEKNAY